MLALLTVLLGILAHVRLLYTDYKDVAIVYICHHLISRAVCSANGPDQVDIYTRSPSLAHERRRSMLDHLRYHGYDGVIGVVAKAGFNSSNLTTVVHRGNAHERLSSNPRMWYQYHDLVL